MKSYAEKENIEQEVLELIRYYIGKVFITYGGIKNYSGLYKDDIESDVCYYIFKTSEKGETFLDKMSKITTLKHLRAFIRTCVVNQVNRKIKYIKSKPIMVSLDYKMSNKDDFELSLSCDNTKDNFNVIPDPNADTERSALIQTALNSISITTYDRYLYEYEKGKFKTLDSEDLIWMITRKKYIASMVNSVIDKNTGEPIDRTMLNHIAKAEKNKLIKELENNIDFWR